jgi:hypothetical protein
MKLRWGIVTILALGVLGTAGTTLSSGAGYTASSVNPRQVFSAAADWVAPAVTAVVPAAPLRAIVTLTATVTDASSIASARIQRSATGAASWTDVCTVTLGPFTCAFDTTAVADGRYDFRATAVDAVANSGTSVVVAGRLVDNTGPVVELTGPGSNVRGTLTLAATADDATGSGVASVRIERSVAAANSWTTICTDTTAPYSCVLDTTTLADDAFDLRAVATDAAGNVTTSALRAIAVDNLAPTVTLADPGSPLSGTVTLATTPADADSGVATVTIQRAAAGGSAWTDVCVRSVAPWSCSFATTGVADGLYDLRAIAVDAAGNSRTSATVASRTIDNTAARGTDVQPANKTGGTAGRLEAGDKITLTYSEAMKATTLISGWSGSAAANLYVRLTDASTVETMRFTVDAAGTTATGLGTIASGGNFIATGATAVFAATATLTTPAGGGSVVTITLGAASSGSTSLLTQIAATALKWTPSATATDLAGNPSSTSVVTESGTSDRDF